MYTCIMVGRIIAEPKVIERDNGKFLSFVINARRTKVDQSTNRYDFSKLPEILLDINSEPGIVQYLLKGATVSITSPKGPVLRGYTGRESGSLELRESHYVYPSNIEIVEYAQDMNKANRYDQDNYGQNNNSYGKSSNNYQKKNNAYTQQNNDDEDEQNTAEYEEEEEEYTSSSYGKKTSYPSKQKEYQNKNTKTQKNYNDDEDDESAPVINSSPKSNRSRITNP